MARTEFTDTHYIMAHYQEKALKPQDFFEKLFQHAHGENAYIEINNLLAHKPVEDISRSEIQSIFQRYEIREEDAQRKKDLIKPLLIHDLLDGVIDETERRQLDHLADILALPHSVISEVLQEMGEELYREAVSSVILHEREAHEDRKYLDTLATTLGLSQEQCSTIEIAQQERFNQGKLTSTALRLGLRDDPPGPDPAALPEGVPGKIGGSLVDKTLRRLFRYRRYWVLRLEPLPEYTVPEELMEEEECHARMEASFAEWDAQHEVPQPSGPELSAQQARQFFWDAQAADLPTVPDHALLPKDKGVLLLTSRRLLFLGAQDTESLHWSRVTDFRIFDSGLLLYPERGLPIFFSFHQDWRELPLILYRILDIDF